MRRSLPAVLALIVTLALVPFADATTIVPVSDTELINGATDVVVARVLGIRSAWLPTTGQIVTDVTVAIDEVLVGDLSTRTVTVRLPGGRIGALDVWAEGTPQFQVGERAVLFL